MWTFGGGPRMCIGDKFIGKIIKVCSSFSFLKYAVFTAAFNHVQSGLKISSFWSLKWAVDTGYVGKNRVVERKLAFYVQLLCLRLFLVHFD